MRRELSLAGTWQFLLDPEGWLDVQHIEPDREITVPLPWQAALPELRHYSGYAYYCTSVELDDAWLEGELLLHFGAVDYWCEVYVNNQSVGTHEGGYTPFACSFRHVAQAGKNEIAVRVFDSAQTRIAIERWSYADGEHPAPPFKADDVPHGKQEWYLNVGGIWQDVKLIGVPSVYLDTIHVTPTVSGEATVAVTLGQADGSRILDGGTLRVTVEGISAEMPLVAGKNQYTLRLNVPAPRLWTPETPNLYSAEVTLEGGGQSDARTVRFGFREITTHEGQLLLNGQPIFLLAALDQDFYPETIYTVPSEAYLRDQFEKAKVLGLNCLRCHIKPPDPLYLDLADEMGLLVWAEIPSWRTFQVKSPAQEGSIGVPEAIQARVEATLHEMIRRDFNHPSLIIWTLVNEDWGTSLPLSAADRAWVVRLYDLCKRLDPTRLAVDNSPCIHAWGPNLHVKSDLDDFHIYMNVPDLADNWDTFMEQFGLRPLWTFSSEGDSQRTGHEPLILSEFGNWGLPLLPKAGEPEPDWFDLGPWWSAWEGSPGWPHGVRERYDALGLSAIWPTYEDFVVATQWHQFTAMKHEIEAMRRQPTLSGYVITEFTDCYWESNGLLDFYRNPKAYHDVFGTINAEDMVIPQPEAHAIWSDRPLRTHLFGSHFSSKPWDEPRLRWQVDTESSEMTCEPVARGQSLWLGTQSWTLRDGDTASGPGYMLRSQFTLDSQAGELARNMMDVLVLPVGERMARYGGRIAVVTRTRYNFGPTETTSSPTAQEAVSTLTADPALPVEEVTIPGRRMPMTRSLEQALVRFGYQVGAMAADTDLIVTDFPSADSLRWVRDGGTMLYLSSGTGPFFFRMARGGIFSGNWMTSFSWLRPGVHQRLAGVSNPLTLPFSRVMPQGAIVGLPMEDRAVQGDVLAGQITGWVGHPAAHTVQFRYGRGKVIMTTYNFRDPLLGVPADPVAVVLLHDLIDYITSPACQPTLKANY